MHHGHRTVTRALVTPLALCATTVGSLLLTAAPSQAEPDLDTVENRVERLERTADTTARRASAVRTDYLAARDHVVAVRAEREQKQAQLDTILGQLDPDLLKVFHATALGSGSAAASGSEALSHVTDQLEFNAEQAAKVPWLQGELERLEGAEQAAWAEFKQSAQDRTRLGKRHQAAQRQVRAAQALLDRLEERAARASRAAERTVPGAAPAASGGAAAAVAYAMTQIGDPYVWGAVGPNAYDCSGLTMAAWAQAGVSLPHSSGAQTGSGTRISADQLQPGDLVFYYSPVSHVGMYIGNGMIVHAPSSGHSVSTAPLYSMPYSGAVRPG